MNTQRGPGYDYSAPGAYFVTIVTHRRIPLFGEIFGGQMRLNEWGRIARTEWLKSALIRSEIALDEFAVMPNHMHAIIIILECNGGFVGAQRRCAPTSSTTIHPIPIVVPRSIGAIIRAYKSAVTHRINQSRRIPGALVWQRNYYEHIVRNEYELSDIRKYIRNNPLQWQTDAENR